MFLHRVMLTIKTSKGDSEMAVFLLEAFEAGFKLSCLKVIHNNMHA